MNLLNRKLLYTPAVVVVGAIAGFSVPAKATLQIVADVNGVTSSCVDNAACDSNPAVGIIQVADGALNGVMVNGSIQTSTGTPANPGLDTLNTSSLSIVNLSGTTKTVTVAVSDTDFTGPIASWASAASGTWQTAIGSSITLNWYNDPTNEQGASTITDTPGTLVDTFTDNATLRADSFSHDGAGPESISGPFSMTEQTILTLAPHAQLVSRGQTEIEISVPEPSTWAMMVLGFAGLGYAAFRRATKSASAVVTLQ
jgi:PEP-CTERM motif